MRRTLHVRRFCRDEDNKADGPYFMPGSEVFEPEPLELQRPAVLVYYRYGPSGLFFRDYPAYGREGERELLREGRESFHIILGCGEEELVVLAPCQGEVQPGGLACPFPVLPQLVRYRQGGEVYDSGLAARLAEPLEVKAHPVAYVHHGCYEPRGGERPSGLEPRRGVEVPCYGVAVEFAPDGVRPVITQYFQAQGR